MVTNDQVFQALLAYDEALVGNTGTLPERAGAMRKALERYEETAAASDPLRDEGPPRRRVPE